MRRAGRPSLVALGLGTGASLVVLWPGVAGALPPGGADDKLGTPAGSVEILGGLRDGKVPVCVRGFVTKDGAAPQQFQVKFDDFGSRGIGPFQPDASGTWCGEIATDRAAYASAASADDKIPSVAKGAPANLCDGSRQHWLRVLSGTWSHPNASERSIAKDIAIDGTCGSGGKAAAPSVGTVIGGDAGVAPPTAGGGTTTPGGTTTTPGTTTPGGTTTTPGTAGPSATTPTVLSGLATLRSTTIAVARGTATLKVRRTAAVGRGTITIRSASRLAVPGRPGTRIRTLVSARPYTLTGEVAQTLRVRLTATGRSATARRPRLRAVVTITPRGAKPTTTRVVLRTPTSSK